jgi:hypothetical protein
MRGPRRPFRAWSDEAEMAGETLIRLLCSHLLPQGEKEVMELGGCRRIHQNLCFAPSYVVVVVALRGTIKTRR